MNSKVIVGLVTVAVLAAVALALAASGMLAGEKSVAPRCDQLSSYSATQAAVTAHRDLVGKIEAAGGSVEVVRGCGGNDTLGVVRIRMAKQRQDAVEQVLNTNDGFGVPLDVRIR